MSDTTSKVREHYNPSGLINRIKTALKTIVTEEQQLTVELLDTAELAEAVKLSSSMPM